MNANSGPSEPSSTPSAGIEPLQAITASILVAVGIATLGTTVLLHPEALGWPASFDAGVETGASPIGYTGSEAMRLDLALLASISLVAAGVVMAVRQAARRMAPTLAPVVDMSRIAFALVPILFLALAPVTKIAIDQEMRRQGPILLDRYDRAIAIVSEAGIRDGKEMKAVDAIATFLVSSSMHAPSIPVALERRLSTSASDTLRAIRGLGETVR